MENGKMEEWRVETGGIVNGEWRMENGGMREWGNERMGEWGNGRMGEWGNGGNLEIKTVL